MSARTKQYDRNRFRKVYPRFRAEPRPGLRVDGDVILESIIVNFSDEDSKAVTLDGPYTTVPTVTVTPVGDISDVNVFVSSVTLQSVPSGSGRKVFVIINSSASFVGKVHLQAILS
jgi:hypothetical protein